MFKRFWKSTQFYAAVVPGLILVSFLPIEQSLFFTCLLVNAYGLSRSLSKVYWDERHYQGYKTSEHGLFVAHVVFAVTAFLLHKIPGVTMGWYVSADAICYLLFRGSTLQRSGNSVNVYPF